MIIVIFMKHFIPDPGARAFAVLANMAEDSGGKRVWFSGFFVVFVLNN